MNHQGGASVESKIKRSRRGLMERKLRLTDPRKSINEHLVATMKNASLKYVPMEERRRQARKPLYLVRYE